MCHLQVTAIHLRPGRPKGSRDRRPRSQGTSSGPLDEDQKQMCPLVVDTKTLIQHIVNGSDLRNGWAAFPEIECKLTHGIGHSATTDPFYHDWGFW
jgi:hypothetical protein